MGSSNGIITPALARATGVRAGFTTRGAEGAVPVDERTAVFGLTQVHSARVVTVTVDDEPGAVAGVEADALVTSRPDACLTVRVADCVPVLVATPDGRAVAAVHAGWRGLAAGILAAAVGRLCALGRCEPADLRAAAGPAIGPCCYEVDLEVGRRIAASAAGGILGAPYGPGKVKADVWRAALNQLADAGIAPGRLEAIRVCTRCHPWLLHSYRRDGPRSGRQLGFISVVPAGGGSSRTAAGP